MFVQDGDQPIFVQNIYDDGLIVGDRVRIRGAGQDGELDPVVMADEVVRVRAGKIPKPLNLKLSEVKIGDHDARFVRAEGFVRQAVSNFGHTVLVCEEGETHFHVCLLGERRLEELSGWIGAEIQTDGALGVTLEAGTENLDSRFGTRAVETLRILTSTQPRFRGKDGQWEDDIEKCVRPKLEVTFLKGQVTNLSLIHI